MAQVSRNAQRGQKGQDRTNGDNCPGPSPDNGDRTGHTPLGVSLSVPCPGPNQGGSKRIGSRAGQRKGSGLPCPADVIERAALIEEGDGAEREAAELRALAEHGLPSWSALALAKAERIREALDRLPHAVDETGLRLLAASYGILEGSHWRAAVSAGWPLSDLFGVDAWSPHDRRELLGLVPRVAFHPRKGRRLCRILEAGAEFQEPDGRLVLYERPSLNVDVSAVCLWWESPAIVADCEAA